MTELENIASCSKPLSVSELVLMQAQVMVGFEREQKAHAARIIATEDKIAAVESKIAAVEGKIKAQDGDSGYMTALGFFRIQGISLPMSRLQAFGKQCVARSKITGHLIGSVPDERYGSVKSYPVELLREVFEGFEVNAQ
ncbi:hypothetical protein CCP4SC76_2160016 [Gammaproteobacteria bacterium]